MPYKYDNEGNSYWVEPKGMKKYCRCPYLKMRRDGNYCYNCDKDLHPEDR